MRYKAWERTAHRKIVIASSTDDAHRNRPKFRGSRYTPSRIGGVSALMLRLRRKNDRHAH
jgi:hypothetical protein